MPLRSPAHLRIHRRRCGARLDAAFGRCGRVPLHPGRCRRARLDLEPLTRLLARRRGGLPRLRAASGRCRARLHPGVIGGPRGGRPASVVRRKSFRDASSSSVGEFRQLFVPFGRATDGPRTAQLAGSARTRRTCRWNRSGGGAINKVTHTSHPARRWHHAQPPAALGHGASRTSCAVAGRQTRRPRTRAGGGEAAIIRRLLLAIICVAHVRNARSRRQAHALIKATLGDLGAWHALAAAVARAAAQTGAGGGRRDARGLVSRPNRIRMRKCSLYNSSSAAPTRIKKRHAHRAGARRRPHRPPLPRSRSSDPFDPAYTTVPVPRTRPARRQRHSRPQRRTGQCCDACAPHCGARASGRAAPTLECGLRACGAGCGSSAVRTP